MRFWMNTFLLTWFWMSSFWCTWFWSSLGIPSQCITYLKWSSSSTIMYIYPAATGQPYFILCGRHQIYLVWTWSYFLWRQLCRSLNDSTQKCTVLIGCARHSTRNSQSSHQYILLVLRHFFTMMDIIWENDNNCSAIGHYCKCTKG